MIPPQGCVTKQGYELQLGTNCLGPFLFTRFLREALEGERVVWLSSSAAERYAAGGS